MHHGRPPSGVYGLMGSGVVGWVLWVYGHDSGCSTLRYVWIDGPYVWVDGVE